MEASQEGWLACAKDKAAATDAILAGNLRDLHDKHTHICDKHTVLSIKTPGLGIREPGFVLETD